MTLSAISYEDKIKLVEALAEKAYRHFGDYCTYTDRNYQQPKHIKYLIGRLEAIERGEIRRLMVFMPPRHGKSTTICKKFPAWYLGRNPDKNIIETSYSYNLVKSFSKDVRDTVESQRYRTVFNISTAEDARMVKDWDIAGHRGGMLAQGVGGSITGYGGDLFIVDDPFANRQEAESKLIRDNIWEWYRNVALTRLEPGAAMILVMTRWHQDDLAGRILKEDPDWEVLNFSALIENDKMAEEDILHRNMSEALWEERFPAAELAITKIKVGSRVWNALFQGNPMDPESQKFLREWFRMYNSLPVDIEIRRGGGIDTATSAKTSADNMAFVDVCRDTNGFLYADDVFCEKISVSGFAKHVSSQHKYKKYKKIRLEANNAGEAIKQRIDEIGREESTMPPVVCEQTSTDKMVRAMEFQHLVENGTLRFRSGNRKVAELIEHLINFDGKGGDIDDDVDALGFAIKAIDPKAEGEILMADWDTRGGR